MPKWDALKVLFNKHYNKMKTDSIKRYAMFMISVGLLFTSISVIWNHFRPMSDGAAGFLAGVGIGLELLGLTAITKYKKRLRNSN